MNALTPRDGPLAPRGTQRLRLPSRAKREVRAQFGALCYRFIGDQLEVLLITSRRSNEWIVPKGWPVNKATGADSAMREAFEEGGVVGHVSGDCFGIYIHYPHKSKFKLPRMVALYPVLVTKLIKDFPEAGQRRRKWYTREKAIRKVANRDLAELILGFEPPHHPPRPT